MADAFFYPRWTEQEGWIDRTATPTPFQVNYFGGMNTEAGRYYLTRFFDIDIPAGATITGAFVQYFVYAKNEGDAQSFTYDFLYEATTTGGTTVRQDATPLRLGIYEDDTANRTWGANHATGATFTWNTTLGDNQLLSVNVTTLIQQAINTNSGRHMNLAFMLKVMTETGDMGIGNNSNGNKQRLLIQYTGGTARTEVVNVNENANFVQVSGDVPATGAPAHWNNNGVYGTYQNNPTYLTQATHSGIPAAPQGGNILKVSSTEADKRAIIWHRSPNDLQWGQWYCFSGFVYVPSGVSDVKLISIQHGVFNDLNRTTTKDAWTRLYLPVLVSADTDPFMGIGSVDGMAVGAAFYIANVNFTKGKDLFPYFDGNTADTATYHRTFDWGGGSTGKRNGGNSYVAYDNLPDAVPLDIQPSMSTHKQMKAYFTYADPYGEAQGGYRIEVRKKRVP